MPRIWHRITTLDTVALDMEGDSMDARAEMPFESHKTPMLYRYDFIPTQQMRKLRREAPEGRGHQPKP